MTLPQFPNFAPKYFLIQKRCPICNSLLLAKRNSPDGIDPYTPKADTVLETNRYGLYCKVNCAYRDIDEFFYKDLKIIGIIDLSHPFFGSEIAPNDYFREEWLKIYPRF